MPAHARFCAARQTSYASRSRSGRPPGRERARAVAAVAVDARAPVDGDERPASRRSGRSDARAAARRSGRRRRSCRTTARRRRARAAARAAATRARARCGRPTSPRSAPRSRGRRSARRAGELRDLLVVLDRAQRARRCPRVGTSSARPASGAATRAYGSTSASNCTRPVEPLAERRRCSARFVSSTSTPATARADSM